MTCTVYGIVHNVDGLVHGSARSTPAAAMLDVQDAVPVDVEHNHRRVGRVIWLERSRNGDVWAVAEVDDNAADGSVAVKVGTELRHVPHDLYWSSETVGGPEDGIALLWLSLTRWPRMVDARPVTVLPGAADHSGVATLRWNLPSGPQRELLTRAASSRVHRKPRDPLQVYDCERAARRAAWDGRYVDQNNLGAWLAMQEDQELAMAARIEYRRGRVLDVR